MNMNFNPTQVVAAAILNDNPSDGTNIVVASGALTINDNSGTGQGWGVSYPWDNLVAGSSLVVANAAGTAAQKTINYAGVVPVVGEQTLINIIPAGENQTQGYQLLYLFASVTLATELTAIAAQITAQWGPTITATATATTVIIVGNFGTASIELQDFSVLAQVNSTFLPVTASTALVQPAGTTQLVGKFFPAGLVTGAGYNTYLIETVLPNLNETPASGKPTLPTSLVLVFQNSATDNIATAGSFANIWNAVVTTGASAIADKLAV